jgi:hypothetical protein
MPPSTTHDAPVTAPLGVAWAGIKTMRLLFPATSCGKPFLMAGQGRETNPEIACHAPGSVAEAALQPNSPTYREQFIEADALAFATIG